MNISNLKLITFDATNTLLRFRVPPWQYYARIAKDHGFHGTEDDVKANLLNNYKVMSTKYPNYGKSSISWESWWSLLVKMTLKDYLPITADLDGIATKLINEFKTTRCWCTVDGGNRLLDHFRKLDMTVGIISNFDPRLNDILQNLRLDKHLDFILTSYECGYSKPDDRIFKKAINMCKNPVNPSEALHIGDDIQNDYNGARAAGWHAVLVNSNVTEKSPALQHVFSSLVDLYNSVNLNKLRL